MLACVLLFEIPGRFCESVNNHCNLNAVLMVRPPKNVSLQLLHI